MRKAKKVIKKKSRLSNAGQYMYCSCYTYISNECTALKEIMFFSNCDRDTALKALKICTNDISGAIEYITMKIRYV